MTSVAPVGGLKRSLCIKPRALMRPSVLMKKPAGSERHLARPGICRQKHLVLFGSPGDPLHGSTSSLRGRERGSAPESTDESPPESPVSCPLGAGVYCWDKSALRLAFIFSSRFTRWPLLTSSSSVLSSADRSWKREERQ